MIAGFFLLVAIATAIGIGVIVWRDMKPEDKWSAVKTAGFAIACCLLALVVLSFIVILF
jgi:hypothetical protein